MTNELNLTDEQVEKAAQVAYNAIGGNQWTDIDIHKTTRDIWRKRILAAATYLQAPIAPPTEEEISNATILFIEVSRTDGIETGIANVLNWFVHLRHSQSPAKPDPRREKIIALIDYYMDSEETDYQFADKILAEFGEVKP